MIKNLFLALILIKSIFAMEEPDPLRSAQLAFNHLFSAISLGIPTEKIKKLSIVKMAEIKTIYSYKEDHLQSYCALLNNGDKIEAKFYIDTGQYHCSRTIHTKKLNTCIILNDDIYQLLKKIYQAS